MPSVSGGRGGKGISARGGSVMGDDASRFKEQFKRKLLWISSVGLLLSCSSVALVSVLPLYNQLQAQQTQGLVFTLQSRKMLVEGFLAKARETARQITSRSKAREALEKYNRREITLSALNVFATPILQDAINLSEFAVAVSRLSRDGTLVVQVGLPVPPRFLARFEDVDRQLRLNGPITIGEMQYIVVSAPILNRQQRRVGTDVVLFEIAELAPIIEDYSGLGRYGELLLGRIDESGAALLFFPSRTMRRDGARVEPHADHAEIAQRFLKEFAVAVVAAGSRVHIRETAHDFVVYGGVAGVDWGLIVMMDKDELFGPIKKQVFTIALVIAVLVIPLGLLVLTLLLRPLSDRMIIHVDTLQDEISAKERAIYQRAQAEKGLLDEKERLNVTLRSIGDGVISTDLDGKIVFINKIAEQLTGWRQQEAIGRPVEQIFNTVNEKSGEPCDNPVSQVLASGEIVMLGEQTTLIARDGMRRFIEDSGAPIFDKQSRIIGTVLVFRDVTEKRKTAAELLKIKRLESVGVLAGGIAHDFNNILAAILGNIELAEISIDPATKAAELLQGAKKASMRAATLTQQLLTFSKGGNPVKKTASIGSTITESADFVLHGSSVSCQFEIPDELWLVDVDTGQISQVIQNLVINAKQAMPQGGEIRIACSNVADIRRETTFDLPGRAYIKIVVRDNGRGIEDEYLEKIFDPYFTTKKEGRGLGLAMTHSIITKHGGHIAVESKVGEGTTFTIYLPAADKQVAPKPEEEGAVPTATRATILIMDDDELVQDIARVMLMRLGHDVLRAQDGAQAIEIFSERRERGEPVDVIIMDLTIPGGMGGKEAVQQILKIDPDAKVIVSSGYSNDPVMTNCQQYGFKRAIPKPFLMKELNKALTEVLS